MATFSVIVPVYNAAHTIQRCVESIVRSCGEDAQIILIEDCSKDNSWQVCCALAQKYPTVIALRNDQNRGVSYTRNRGLDAATGEYLLFVDSDDWVEPKWSRALHNAILRDPRWLPVCGFQKENSNDTKDCFCLWAEQDSVQSVTLQHAFELLDKVLLQQLWTKIFSRQIICQNQIHFDETQSMGEDLQFVLDYISAANLLGFTMISQPLYHYNCDSGTLMRNFGLTNRSEEYKRIEQLGRITGNVELCALTIDTLKRNHAYHILRSKLPKKEKISLVEEILGPNARSFCRTQRRLVLKEKIIMFINIFLKGNNII